MPSPRPRDILNEDVPRQEPRRPFGRAIVDEMILFLYVTISFLSFNRLPRAGSTQKQAFAIGSCVTRQPQYSTNWYHGPSRSKFHPDLASSALHVDDAQESLKALQESADALPDPHLKTHVKSAVSHVSVLWETAKSKKKQAWSRRSLKVLETLAEAVGPDSFNISPLMLDDIRSFEILLLEIRTAMERSWTLRLFRSNRRENDFDKRLSKLQRNFEEACSQRSGFDTPVVSAGVPLDSYSHTLESNPFRSRSRFSGLKSRLSLVSSTCVDVASTTLTVLEKLGSAVPIISGVVSGVSALLETSKRVNQLKEKAQASLQHLATLTEDANQDQSNMLELLRYEDELSEAHAALVLIMGQGWISRLLRLNRNEDILDTFDRRLIEMDKRLTASNLAQIKTKLKHIADSLLTGYSKTRSRSSPFASNRLILIPGYSSITLCKAVAVLHG
ncbi:hypothetical protein BGY98DRAFT_931565 [Russula aff. rugulosa BPL654]|nr:hypothetical protein BGY98DRAFT_931565 [Russula aff. rugulosa BPL654]